ncbi:hypothetical protein ABPG74_009492 [Tetrahymena malaccensis]
MEKQQKFNTICRNITEYNFCQFGNSCRYLHPGDVTTKVFIEKIDKKSKSKSRNSGKNTSEKSEKKRFLKSPSSLQPTDNSSNSPECRKNYSTQAPAIDSVKNTPPITYKLNSMNDDESLKDALKNEKGWRNKIKSQAKKITFEIIPEYAQTILNPGSSNITQVSLAQNSGGQQKNELQTNQRAQQQTNDKNHNIQNGQVLDSEAKLRQVNYKKQLERQLEGSFISIESINQDLNLVTKDKQVILYDQLIPQIEEDIELTDKFQIHSIIKLTHLNDVIKLFYDPQSCQLYILQLNQSQKKMKFYIIEEVYQYLTHYSKDFNLFFIVVANVDKENIGFFPLPEKRESQYLEPIIVKNYNETIINFQKTEQTLNINLYKGVIIEEFQLISQEICQEVRAQNGESKEFNENQQEMIVLEQITPQNQAKQNKKKMILSDSESENENDLEMSRYFQNKSSQNLLKYLSQSSTIHQDSELNNKNSILNQSSILIDVGSIKEKKSLENIQKINSLQSTEASDIFSSPQVVSPKNENIQEPLPKTTANTDKQKEQLSKNSKTSVSLNRSKEVSNSMETKKQNEKLNQLNSKIKQKNEETNQIIGQTQKNKILMNIEEDDLFPNDNNLLEQLPEIKTNKETKQTDTTNKSEEGKGQSENKKQKITQNSLQNNQQNSKKLSHTLSKIIDIKNITNDDSTKEIIQISISSSNSLSLQESDNGIEEFKRQKQDKNKKQTSEVDEEFDIENNLFNEAKQKKKCQSKEIKKENAFLKASKANKIVSKIKQKISKCIASSEPQMQDQKKQNQENSIQSDIEKLKSQEKHSQLVDPKIRKQKVQDQNTQTNQVNYKQKCKESLNTDQYEQYLKNTQKNYQEASCDDLKEFQEECKKVQTSQQTCNQLELQQNSIANQPNVLLNQTMEVNSKLEKAQNGIQNEKQTQNNAQNSVKSNNVVSQDVIAIRSDIILNKKKLQLVKYLKKEDIMENIKKMQIQSVETKQNNLSGSKCDESQVQKLNLNCRQSNIEKKDNLCIINKNNNYTGQYNSEIKSVILDSNTTNQQPIEQNEPVAAAIGSHESKQNIKRKKIVNMNKIKREELNNDYYDNLNLSNTYKYVKMSYEEPKQVDVNMSSYQILSEEDFNNNKINQKYKQNLPSRVTSMVGDNEEIIITDDEGYLEDDIEETILNEGPRRMYNNMQYDQQDKKNINFNQTPQFVNQPQTYLQQPNQQFNFQHQQVQSMNFFQPLQTNLAPNFTQNQIQYLSHLQSNPMLPLNIYSQCRGQTSFDFGYYNQHSFYQPPLQYNQQIQITDLELAQIELQKYQYIQQLIN